jgi:hypothetical protein
MLTREVARFTWLLGTMVQGVYALEPPWRA